MAKSEEDARTARDGNTTSFWDVKFDSKPPLGLESENVPYIQLLDDTLSETSIVQFFMTESGAANRMMPQVELVANFCPDSTLEDLDSGGEIVTSKAVCILDDRTNDGKVSISLGYLGPLNVHQFYLKMKKERFQPKEIECEGKSLEDSKEQVRPPRNADRRLIFITDLNRWTMMAIVSTASRSATSPPPTDIDFLCEAQVSVLITGLDLKRWVAYCFVDTYFEKEDRREGVESYDDEVEFDEDDKPCCQPDPFTSGESDATLPVLCPREYFVVVLESRLRQIRDEWHVVVIRMELKIETYISTCPITRPHVLPPGPGDAPTVGLSRSWTVHTRNLLRKLTQNLQATINQLEYFQADQTFTTVRGPASRYIPTILATTKDLRIYLQDLDFLRQDCDKYIDDLSFYMNNEVTLNAKLQARTAELGQMTTFVMIYVFTPIALSASVLSMQEKAIPPPLRLNGMSFIILVIVFMVFVSSAVGTMRNMDRIKRSVLQVFKRTLHDADLENQEDERNQVDG
ncbi:hypothetical protein AUP68_02620 [Ilyonectria robusta]